MTKVEWANLIVLTTHLQLGKLLLSYWGMTLSMTFSLPSGSTVHTS